MLQKPLDKHLAQEEFNCWLRFFAQWLKRSMGKPGQIKSQSVLEYERWLPSTEEDGRRRLASRLSLLNEDDPLIPSRFGAICTWKLICHQAPQGAVLITLDNLFRLSKEIPPNSPFAPSVKTGLQRSLGLTHRFQVIWLFRVNPQKPLRFTLIDAFDIDLSCQYVDESPKDIIKHLAIQTFSMREIPSMDWKERIYFFPWYDLIAELSPRKGCPTNPRYRILCKRIQSVTFR
jgi:hypothetical protein